MLQNNVHYELKTIFKQNNFKLCDKSLRQYTAQKYRSNFLKTN